MFARLYGKIPTVLANPSVKLVTTAFSSGFVLECIGHYGGKRSAQEMLKKSQQVETIRLGTKAHE